MKTQHSFHLFSDPEANKRLVSHFPDLISVKPMDDSPLNSRGRPTLTVNPVSMTWEQRKRIQELRNELQTLKSYRTKAQVMGVDVSETDAKIIVCRKEIERVRANETP